MKTETCIYCGAELPEQPEREGDWWKTHDWRAEREIHNEGCEWVETQAHTRINGQAARAAERSEQ